MEIKGKYYNYNQSRYKHHKTNQMKIVFRGRRFYVLLKVKKDKLNFFFMGKVVMSLEVNLV